MHSAPPSQVDCIRLATAVAVVRCKPANQSYSDYVLHLQTILPRTTRPCTPCGCRDRSEALERSLASLKEQLRAEQIRSAGLSRALASTDPATAAKLHQSRADDLATCSLPFVDHLKSLLAGADDASTRQPLGGKHRLMNAWIAVEDTLLAIEGGLLPNGRDLLAASSVRALELLADTLRPPNLTISSLSTAETLVAWLVPRVLPCLLYVKQKQAADAVLADLASVQDFLKAFSAAILTPIVSAFLPVSKLHLASLLSPARPGAPPGLDLRTHMLSLFVHSLRLCDVAMRDCAPAASTCTALLDSLALTVLREMARVADSTSRPAVPVGPDPTANGQTTTASNPTLTALSPGSPPEMDSLARKDALWYLATLAHAIFSLGTTAGKSDVVLDDLLTSKMADLLGEMLASCRRTPISGASHPSGIAADPSLSASSDSSAVSPSSGVTWSCGADPVTYDLILGVAEAFWASRCAQG